jgi:alkylation response protein AidB-like acyl-CoA dehydrogenase
MTTTTLRLALSEDQEALSRNARRFVDERSPLARLRRIRDGADSLGFSLELWRELAELGFLGLHLPESEGGAGLALLDTCLVFEAAGRRLMPEPLLSALLAAEVLGASRRSEDLGALLRGEALFAVAHQEAKSRYALDKVATLAEGTVLSGEKLQVLAGQAARAFIVSARQGGDDGDGGRLALFRVDAGAPGVSVVPQHRIDGRSSAIVRFDRAPAELLVQDGLPLLRRAVDRATIALSFEMLGAASQAFEITLEYLKTRKQFGTPIGSFQALQHRAARMFIELTLARSAAVGAAVAQEAVPAELPRFASLAKARCSEVFIQVASEGVQMHGGVGVTDEFDIGLYLKRARAADATFGDVAWHRRRWAELSGY